MQQYIVQPSDQDCYYVEALPDTQYCALTYNIVGCGAASTQDARALFRWNISSIPAGSTIVAVQIELYLETEARPNPCSVDVHRVTSAWPPCTWNNQPSWDATILANKTIDPVGWYTWTGLAQLVQNWLDGVWTNYGVMLKQHVESQANQAKRLATLEYPTESLRPKLVVDAEPPTIQPYGFIM